MLTLNLISLTASISGCSEQFILTETKMTILMSNIYIKNDEKWLQLLIGQLAKVNIITQTIKIYFVYARVGVLLLFEY